MAKRQSELAIASTELAIASTQSTQSVLDARASVDKRKIGEEPASSKTACAFQIHENC
jgi:hypothetical protein